MLADSRVPNEAFRQFHRQLMEKAIESLATQTPATRVSSSDVIAIDSKYLPKVDRLSRDFSREVMKLAEKSATKDSVYSLVVHFFRLTDKGESK